MDGANDAEASARAAKLARDLAAREQELAEQRRELKLLRSENGELKQRVRAAEEEIRTMKDSEQEKAAATTDADAAFFSPPLSGQADQRVAYLEEQVAQLRALVAQVQGEKDFYNESFCKAQLELERCSAALLQASNNETIANVQLADARKQLAVISESHRQDGTELGRQRARADDLARQLEVYKQKELELATLLAGTQSQLQKTQKQAAELHEKVLLVDETNAGLRREIAAQAELLETMTNAPPRDYAELLQEIEDARKEVAKLMAEKQRLQSTIALNKEVLADTDTKMMELQRELLKERNARQALARKKSSAGPDDSHIRKLLDEIHTLKLENAQLASQHPHQQPFHHGITVMGATAASPGGAESLEAERLKVRRAEAALRALQKRVAYLLQVTEHSNKLAARWQEQKQLLKAQLAGMSRANHELRNRLLQAEGQLSAREPFRPTFQTEVDVSDVPSTGGMSGRGETEGESVVMNGTPRADPNGVPNGQTGIAAAQSVAAQLELAVLDASVAFSCGMHTSRRVPRGQLHSAPQFALTTKPDGTHEIKVDANDISGHELMSKLQLKSFVRFVQSTRATDPVKACLEKMLAVINRTRAMEHAAIQKASRAKLDCAKLSAQLVAWQLRVAGLKQYWNETKLSRHKTTIKYAKEVVASWSAAKAAQTTGSEDSNNNLLSDRSLPSASQSLTETATASSDSSSDLRMAGCMVDDETLYNVLRVIGGTLDDRESILACLGPKLQNVMLDQPILLANYGHVASVVRLDLSNNYLTDMAAKLLAELVERATALCFLDLQKNCITSRGVELLKEAVRRNKTILYCSTFHNGFYLEGVRETALPERNPIASTLSAPRARKPSLTIDVRQCDPDKELLLLSMDAAVQEATELGALQSASTLAQTGRPSSARRSVRSSSPMSSASPERRRPASASMKRPRSAFVQRPHHMSSKPGQMCTDDEASEESRERLPRHNLGGMLDERIRAMEKQGIRRSSSTRPQSAPANRSPLRGSLRATAPPPISRRPSPSPPPPPPLPRPSSASSRSRTPDRRPPGVSNLTQRTIDAYKSGPISATMRQHNSTHPSPLNSHSAAARPPTGSRGIRGIRGHKPVQGMLF